MKTKNQHQDGGWFPIDKFAVGGEVFTAYAPHYQGGFQFSAVCNANGRILCVMSLDDMTDQVTHARKQFDPPVSQNAEGLPPANPNQKNNEQS